MTAVAATTHPMDLMRNFRIRRLTGRAVLRNLFVSSRQKKDPQMGQAAFHAPHGGSVFLGIRKNRTGATEIVYDDGVARRLIWRVTEALADEGRLSDALSRAVRQTRVLPALYSELKKRAIAVEAVIR